MIIFNDSYLTTPYIININADMQCARKVLANPGKAYVAYPHYLQVCNFTWGKLQVCTRPYMVEATDAWSKTQSWAAVLIA